MLGRTSQLPLAGVANCRVERDRFYVQRGEASETWLLVRRRRIDIAIVATVIAHGTSQEAVEAAKRLMTS